MRRAPALTVLAAIALANPARGQTIRDTLRMGIQAYDDFNPAAMQLLRRGLNPNGGPPDALWSSGLHRLAQLYLDNAQSDEALRWLRWALRVAPTLPVDTTFPPIVVNTFQSARSIVEASRVPRSRAEPSWTWTPSGDATAPGRVTYAVADTTTPAEALVVGIGVIPPEGLPVPPGQHRIQASAEGYETAEIATEILPGVATHVRIRLRDLNPGLLYVASEPWGTVYIDDERIGYTTLSAHPLSSGSHTIRITRPGFFPLDTTVTIRRGERLRMGTIRLIPREE